MLTIVMEAREEETNVREVCDRSLEEAGEAKEKPAEIMCTSLYPQKVHMPHN